MSGTNTPIYVASRASVPERPTMWRALRDSGWNITSTWIDEANPGETDDYEDLWLRIVSEIEASAGVVLYAKAEDFPLKGALVEAGMAIGMTKPVAIVLSDDIVIDRTLRPIGSWIKHPLCKICRNVPEAREWIALMDIGFRVADEVTNP